MAFKLVALGLGVGVGVGVDVGVGENVGLGDDEGMIELVLWLITPYDGKFKLF